MIGESADGWKWAQASGLSAALHAAVFGYLVYQPTLDFLLPDPAEALSTIEITTLTPPAAPDIPEVPTETLTSAADPAAGAEAEAVETAITTPPPELAPASPVEMLASKAESQQTLLSGAGEVPGGTGTLPPDDPAALPIKSADAGAPPPDPRLLQLIDRIRGELSDPCLLAMPMMRGDNQLTLSLLSDSDRNISALTGRLTAGIEGEIAQETLLLDSRQCPAIAFVRRDQRYPVFALGLQIDAQSVATGDRLRGQITNGAGYVQTLLLVDENGAVLDLRRFLAISSRVTHFDFPVARKYQPRDTRQLLIAIATPKRVSTVTERAGDAAGPFFDALQAEIGQDALIGITSIDVR